MIDPDTLVAHSQFVRKLARSLVSDEDQVEDITQETLLAALNNPRDLMRKVVEAVFSLREPYRTTVIQRFYEGHSTQDIAHQEELPVATVRTRLSRALQMLRGELDRSHHGKRDVWLGGLIPILGLPPGVDLESLSPGPPGTSRGLFFLSFLGVATLLLTGVWWFGFRNSETGPSSLDGNVVSKDDSGIGNSDSTTRPGSGGSPELPDGPTDSPQERAVNESPSRFGSLRVLVKWPGGARAAGIKARLVSFDLVKEQLVTPCGQAMNLTTGQDGIFFVPRVSPGEKTLILDRMRGGSNVRIVPGKESRLEVELPDGIDIKVRVVDEVGRGVEGADILLATSSRFSDSGVILGQSGPRGEFFFRCFSKSRFIGARKDGHAPSRMIYLVGLNAVGTRDIALTLPTGGGVLRGRVIGPDPSRIKTELILEDPRKVKAGSTEDGGYEMITPPYRFQTDENGTFLLTNLFLGAGELHVRAPGFAPRIVKITLERDPLDDLEIHLDLPVSLYGRVTGEDGGFVGGAKVLVRDGAVGAFLLPTIVESGSDGSYRVTGIAPGEFRVEVTTGDNAGRTFAELRAGSGVEYEWNPVLDRGATIQGTLRSEKGEPLRGWRVVAWGPYASVDPTVKERIADLDATPNMTQERLAEQVRALQEVECLTDREGKFLLSNRLDVLHRVDVFGPEQTGKYPCVRTTGVRPDQGELLIEVSEKLMPTAGVRGQLLLADGTPVPEARVELIPRSVDVPSDRVYLLDSGRFALGPVAPGSYLLAIQVLADSGSQTKEAVLREIELVAGEEIDLGSILLQPTGSVRVKVTREEEFPGDPDVVLMDAWMEKYLPIQLSGADYVATGLLPGRYFFCVLGFPHARVGSMAVPFEVLPDEETLLSVPFQRGERWVWRFEPEKPPASWEFIQFVLRDENRAPLLKLKTNLKLQKIMDGLSLLPGRYEMDLTMDSGLVFSKTFEISPGHDPASILVVPVR